MENNYISNYPENNAINNTEGEGELRKPSLGLICALYSITVIIFLIVGSKVQRNEFYSGVLVTEFGIIMLPALIMLLALKYDVRKILRLNKIGILNLFIIFWIMVFALPAVGVLNYINLMLIKQIFGRVVVEQVPVAKDLNGLILNILVIGGSAGICEELLFRGVIQRGFEKLGTVRSILITALLFGLLHVDFQKLFGTFLLGALIGFIVYRTNSLYGGIFAHFTNNSLAVVLTFLVNKAVEMIKSSGLDQGQYNINGDLPSLANMTAAQLMGTIILYGTILGVCVLFLAGLITALIRNTEGRAEKVVVESPDTSALGVLWALPGLLMIGFIYFVQGIGMLGIKIKAVETILQLLGLR